ncbi:hypothetical protein O9992_19655 [Vibrio lentus]|nr:hypothetical protein [Vibrio lentus]
MFLILLSFHQSFFNRLVRSYFSEAVNHGSNGSISGFGADGGYNLEVKYGGTTVSYDGSTVSVSGLESGLALL